MLCTNALVISRLCTNSRPKSFGLLWGGAAYKSRLQSLRVNSVTLRWTCSWHRDTQDQESKSPRNLFTPREASNQVFSMSVHKNQYMVPESATDPYSKAWRVNRHRHTPFISVANPSRSGSSWPNLFTSKRCLLQCKMTNTPISSHAYPLAIARCCEFAVKALGKRTQ